MPDDKNAPAVPSLADSIAAIKNPVALSGIAAAVEAAAGDAEKTRALVSRLRGEPEAKPHSDRAHNFNEKGDFRDAKQKAREEETKA